TIAQTCLFLFAWPAQAPPHWRLILFGRETKSQIGKSRLRWKILFWQKVTRYHNLKHADGSTAPRCRSVKVGQKYSSLMLGPTGDLVATVWLRIWFRSIESLSIGASPL